MGWLTSYEPSPAHPRGTDPFFSYVAADPAQPICDFLRRSSPFSAHHFEKKIVYKFNNGTFELVLVFMNFPHCSCNNNELF